MKKVSEVILSKNGAKAEDFKDELKSAGETAEDDVEDKEVEATINPDIKEVRKMLNEIEEILEDEDGEEISVPAKDYVENLKMTLTRFVEGGDCPHCGKEL